MTRSACASGKLTERRSQHLDHLCRFDLADMEIGARHTAQHVGERRQVARPIRIQVDPVH